MSMSPFEHFIDLVKFDQQITKMHHMQEQKQQEFVSLEDIQHKLQTELELLKQAVHQAQKMVHEQELEAKKVDIRIADIKKKLEDIENAKQYVALKKEIESAQKTQLQLEDALIAAWNQLENAQRNHTQKKDLIVAKSTENETKIAQIKQEIHDLQTQIEVATQQRPSKVQLVNADWLQKYENMQGRVENPVVEVMHGSCGGCFYAIPQQELTRLKNRALLQCSSCYRFLYDPQVLQMKSTNQDFSALS